MGSYSYLMIVDKVPDKDWKYNSESFDVATFKYSYPMGLGILFQNSPKICPSPCYVEEDGSRIYKAIIAKYDEKNIDEFIKYLKHVANNSKGVWSNKESKVVPFTDYEYFDNLEKSLKGDKFKNKYFLLDVNDVAGMSINVYDDKEYKKKLDDITEEILNDIKKSDFIEKLYAGKFLDSLDEYTRGAFWELLDKSNSSVRGFTKNPLVKHKNGKKLLVKENADMANFEGLFDLEGINEAKDDDILAMKLTEEAEFKDHCPSMDPETHFDKDNSGNKEIPVPGGDKEEPTAKADEKEIPVPGGDKEQPDTKTKDETPIPTGGKVVLDDATYNAALDNLQKSFKEAVEVVEMIKNADRINESFDDVFNEYMESAMDNAFLDYSAGPLFEKVSAKEDKEALKELIGKIKDDAWKYIKEDLGSKVYKPVRILRSLIDAPNFLKWKEFVVTYAWQVLGMAIIEPQKAKEVEEELNKKFKDELGNYKIFVMRSTESLLDLFRIEHKSMELPHLIFIDKKVPTELKEIAEVKPEETK